MCRDDRERVLTMIASQIFATTPLVAEAMGLREAVQLGLNLQLEQVIFESDNLDPVEACRGNRNVREIEGFVQDILNLKTEFQSSGIVTTTLTEN